MRALCLAVLPCLAPGLWFQPPLAGSGHLGTPRAARRRAAGHTAPTAHQSGSQQAAYAVGRPSFGSDELAVGWQISKMESGAEVGLFWDHGCNPRGATSGECIFKKGDTHNRSGMRIRVSDPLDDKAQMKVTIEVSIMGMSYTLSADCAVCGEACTIPRRMGPPFEVLTPACPLPLGAFEVTMAEVDMSGLPWFVSGQVRTIMDLVRSDGQTVAEVVTDTWI